jgi:hypothetical protein
MFWRELALWLLAFFICSECQTLRADAILRRVFGFNASPLKENFDELFQAVVAARNSNIPGEEALRPPHHHICCSALSVKEALSFVNPRAFRLVYAFQTPKLACFVSDEKVSVLSTIPQSVFSDVVPVELFLRLHPSVMQMAQYVIDHGDAGKDPVSLYLTRGLCAQRLALSDTKSAQSVKRLRQRLRSDDHDMALAFARKSGVTDDNISLPYSSGSWLSLIRSMAAFVHISQSRGERVSSVCGYEMLRISEHRRGIRVTGAQRLRRAECILLLAAHLIMVDDDVFAVTAVAETIKSTNDFTGSLLRKSPPAWRRVYDTTQYPKLVFIHIPKCGGTYAARILRELNIKNNHHNVSVRTNSVSFGIVRHPVERFESFLNYRMGLESLREDWPSNLSHVLQDKQVSLSDIALALRDSDMLNFGPFKTLVFWTANIDILITIDQLEGFLEFWGYRYNASNFIPVNISPKTRGRLNSTARAKVADVFRDDIAIYQSVLQQYK